MTTLPTFPTALDIAVGLDDVLEAGDLDAQVQRAWIAAQELRLLYREPDRVHAERRLLRWLTDIADHEIPELLRLARTLDSWRDELLAYFDTNGVSNGPTEAVNGLIKKIKRVGHGYRNFTNYRLRLLLRCGITWHTPATTPIRGRLPRLIALSPFYGPVDAEASKWIIVDHWHPSRRLWVVGPSCRPNALVHVTAVPAPGIVPDHLTFMNNIACTWNVVSAARRAGRLLTRVNRGGGMKYERAPEYEQQFTRLNTPYASEWPDRRPLKIFALDPLRGKTAGNEVTITIPNEMLMRGPASERIKVIDYDGTLNVYYAPVDLDEGPILMRNGLDPSESDPRFHQQMVYAVTMRVLENFERALGRRLHFARGKQLRILPHAFRGANAFFDPSTNSVLFGYFAADAVDPGENLPGQTVFSCLSHDIVAHEVTHAIVHRLRRHYNEPTNLDVLAFHEAIADIVAIFQHFTIPEVLRNELQRQHGDLSRPGTLLELAKQFGHGTGRSEALRTALGPDEDSNGEKPKRPKADDYLKIREPHARGSLLVAAVFDAFFVAYQNRIRDVVRLATNGTGVLPTGDIPSDLVTILAAEAATAAQQTLAMCIRAFEFLPPVDVTFGDYLRALVTADRDLYPEDRFQMRSALIEAFRVRGIYPRDVDSLAEESLVWPTPKKPSATTANPEPKDPLPPLSRHVIGDLMAREVLGEDGEDEDDDAPPSAERAAAWTLTDYAKENAAELKLTPGPDPKISVHGFHPTFRIGSNGRVRVDVHAQFIQERPPKPGDEASYGGLRLYSGTTVVFGDDGAVRYLIAKPLSEEDVKKRGKRLRSLATIKEYIDALDDEDREMIWRDDVFLQRRMIERANFAALDRQGRAR